MLTQEQQLQYLHLIPNSRTAVRQLITKLKRELASELDKQTGVEFKPPRPQKPLHKLELEELRIFAADLMWRCEYEKNGL